MRRVHCRKCWQQNSLLTKRCSQCGDIDTIRLGRGLAELAAYIVGGAGAIALIIYTSMAIL
jgi:hypothetical protein